MSLLWIRLGMAFCFNYLCRVHGAHNKCSLAEGQTKSFCASLCFQTPRAKMNSFHKSFQFALLQARLVLTFWRPPAFDPGDRFLRQDF